MSQELWYTSAPRGLKPGSRGFCTVTSTQGMAANLSQRLESLSGYRHLISGRQPGATQNPVIFSHLRITLGGRPFHVLSRITDTSADYSGRSNKFAHHLVLSPAELPPGGPAWLMMQPGVMETAWDGQLRVLPRGRTVPSGDRGPAVCTDWKGVVGDAGWGGVLAESALRRQRVFLLFEPGTRLLPLLAESLALLPAAARWQVTLSTYMANVPADVDCLWRGVVMGGPGMELVRRARDALVIDLTRPMGPPPASPWVEAARSGTRPRSPDVSPASAAPAASGRPEHAARQPPAIDACLYAVAPLDEDGIALDALPLVGPPPELPRAPSGIRLHGLRPKRERHWHLWTALSLLFLLIFGGGGTALWWASQGRRAELAASGQDGADAHATAGDIAAVRNGTQGEPNGGGEDGLEARAARPGVLDSGEIEDGEALTARDDAHDSESDDGVPPPSGAEEKAGREAADERPPVSPETDGTTAEPLRDDTEIVEEPPWEDPDPDAKSRVVDTGNDSTIGDMPLDARGGSTVLTGDSLPGDAELELIPSTNDIELRSVGAKWEAVIPAALGEYPPFLQLGRFEVVENALRFEWGDDAINRDHMLRSSLLVVSSGTDDDPTRIVIQLRQPQDVDSLTVVGETATRLDEPSLQNKSYHFEPAQVEVAPPGLQWQELSGRWQWELANASKEVNGPRARFLFRANLRDDGAEIVTHIWYRGVPSGYPELKWSDNEVSVRDVLGALARADNMISNHRGHIATLKEQLPEKEKQPGFLRDETAQSRIDQIHEAIDRRNGIIGVLQDWQGLVGPVVGYETEPTPIDFHVYYELKGYRVYVATSAPDALRERVHIGELGNRGGVPE